MIRVLSGLRRDREAIVGPSLDMGVAIRIPMRLGHNLARFELEVKLAHRLREVAVYEPRQILSRFLRILYMCMLHSNTAPNEREEK